MNAVYWASLIMTKVYLDGIKMDKSNNLISCFKS